MTIEEYFGDWMDVIDKDELVKISAWLKTQNPNILCPAHKDVFKAFRMCSLADCKVIMVGQDPFPQKGVATGILFGNKPNTTNISDAKTLAGPLMNEFINRNYLNCHTND